jgi:hypothetical protein
MPDQTSCLAPHNGRVHSQPSERTNTAGTRQLQHAMSLHWALRLGGKTREVILGLSDAQEKTLEAWVSLSGHLGEHSTD